MSGFKGYLRQKGLSLVELMVALTLGSVVTVGVVQLFVANSQTYKLLVGQSRMQESARFTLEFIGRAAHSAGYKGCYSTNDGVITTLDPPTNIPYEFELRVGVLGYDGAAGTWNPSVTSSGISTTLPSSVGATDSNVFSTTSGTGCFGSNTCAGNGIDTSAIVEGTDILTMRNLSKTDARLVTPMPTSSEDIEVAIPVNGIEFEVDHVVLISDCEKGTLFTVTGISEAAGVATIAHVVGTTPTSNTFARLADVNTYETDAAVAAIETNTFYIAPGEGLNNIGDQVLSLWRKTGVAEPVELVEGVEDLQVLYGVDTDGDDVPNQYLVANLADVDEIVTIRVAVTVNSVDEVGAGTADGLLRRTFTQTIKLRNRG